jgi:hypothetical protein
MATRSLQDQVKSVLGRTVAEAKTRGIPNAPIESAALVESIALTLLLHPRAAIYFMLLAKNGLLSALNDELAAVDTLNQTVLDLANQSYIITDVSSLEQARTALLQLERAEKVSPSSSTFKRFDSNVSDFLNKQLAPNVKKQGSTSMLRPAAEAKLDFPVDLASLKDVHADVLDRLYAIVVGLDNFLSSPLSTILGITTATRARVDIEQMLLNPDPASSRDMATTLVANRAALKVLGSAPSPMEPVLSGSLPAGYVLKIKSDSAKAKKSQTVSPPTFPVGAALNLSTVSIVRSANFPQTTTDLQNQGHLVSNVISFPVTIPAGYSIFLTFTKVDGSTISYKVPLSASMVLADVIAAINSTVGTDGTASEYIAPGSSRIIIWANAPNVSLTIDSSYVDTNFAGSGLPAVFTNSAHDLLGFVAGQQSSILGTTPLSTIADAIALYWPDAATVSLNGSLLEVTGVDSSPGAYLSFTGTAADSLGLTGIWKATSKSLRLYGTVNGVPTDPVDPIILLQLGDQVSISTGVSLVEGLSPSRVTMTDALPTVDEVPSADSAVSLAWQVLISGVKSYLPTWVSSGYQQDLSTLDRILAPLNASAGPAQVNAATNALAALRSKLVELKAVVNDSSAFLPDNAATEERQIVAGILTSLAERKFDRAIDLFLRGKLQEALGVDHQTASFSGAFLKAASDVAQTDFKKVNRAQDEGLASTTLTARTP